MSGAAPTEPVLPHRRFGGYELVRELGRGGMGVVWEARHVALDRLVALKLLEARGDQTEAERFLREARALDRLQHPAIVSIHDAGRVDGVAYLAMRLIRGETLRARVQRLGPLDPRDAARLCARLADALAAAHREGIVHRDVKPQNVLLEPDGHPVLTDFGLARLQGSRTLTATDAVLGTPAYMAPEQVEGRVDPRADLYGLGATLYEALCGSPPFHGGPVAVINAVLHHRPEPPSARRPGIPAALEAVCLRCLEKDPARRFQRAEELGAALQAIVAGRAAEAPRRPAPWLAAVGVLLLAGAAWVLLRGPEPEATPAAPPVAPPGRGSQPAPAPRVVEAPPPDPVAAELQTAERLLLELEVEQAALHLDRAALAAGPDDQRVLLMRARALILACQSADSVRLLERVSRLGDPELALEADLLRAAVESTRAGAGAEMGRLQLAARRFPDRGEAAARGLVAALHGVSVSEAVRQEWIAQLRQARPSPEALRVRAWLLEFEGGPSGQERSPELLERAEATLAEALALDPLEAEALALRAWMRVKFNRWAEAEADYRESARRYGARLDLASLLVRLAARRLTQLEEQGPVEQRPSREAESALTLAGTLDRRNPLVLVEQARRLELGTWPGPDEVRGQDPRANPADPVLHTVLQLLCEALFRNPTLRPAQERLLRLLDGWRPDPARAEVARKRVSQRCHDLNREDPLALAAHAAIYEAARARHETVRGDAWRAAHELQGEWRAVGERLHARVEAWLAEATPR